MNSAVYLQWDFLAFVVPMGMVIIISLVGMLSGAEHGHHDADMHGHDMGGGSHGGHGHHGEHDSDHDSDTNFGRTLLTFFGVGRVPITLVALFMGVTWGFSGLVAKVGFNFPWFLSMPVAFAVMCMFAPILSKTVGKAIPSGALTQEDPAELEGKEGTALFQLSGEAGMVRVTDDHGSMRDLPCRTEGGEIIREGELVAVTRYDPATGYYTVIKKSAALPQG